MDGVSTFRTESLSAAPDEGVPHSCSSSEEEVHELKAYVCRLSNQSVVLSGELKRAREKLVGFYSEIRKRFKLDDRDREAASDHHTIQASRHRHHMKTVSVDMLVETIKRELRLQFQHERLEKLGLEGRAKSAQEAKVDRIANLSARVEELENKLAARNLTVEKQRGQISQYKKKVESLITLREANKEKDEGGLFFISPCEIFQFDLHSLSFFTLLSTLFLHGRSTNISLDD